MSKDVPIFTREELKLFWFELKSKFRGGLRSPAGFLYIALTLVGVAWATWGIPSLNKSETSPETLGIYVIGFLVTVMLDALISWKKNGDDKKYEQAISGIFIVASLVLIVFASSLSLKTFRGADLIEPASWKAGATPLLLFVFCLAVVMSLVLTGIDPKIVPIGALDTPVNNIADRP